VTLVSVLSELSEYGWKMVPWGLEPSVWLSRREQREKEHSVWLVNRQEKMLIQFKSNAATQHAQFVLVSYYRLSARHGQPVTP